LKMGSLDILSLMRGSRPRKIATQLLQYNELPMIRSKICKAYIPVKRDYS
jgi:hypothetical protein